MNFPRPGVTDPIPATYRRSARDVLLDLLILFPTVLLLMSEVSQLFDLGVSRWHMPSAIGLTVAIAFLMHRNVRRLAHVCSLLVFLAIFGLSILLALLFVDQWYDSRAYHGPAAVVLAGGWSPYLDWSVCADANRYCLSSHIYLDHYAKAAWTLSAGLYAATSKLEILKGFNFYLICLAGVAAYHVGARMLVTGGKTIVLLAVCIAANPVAMAQITSNYIDGLFASYLSIYVLQLLDFSLRSDRQALRRALIILPVLLNIKLTAVVYVPIMTIALLTAYVWYQRRGWLKPGLCLGIVGVFCVVGVGFNPYVSNLLTRGEPFWPAYSFKTGVSAISSQAAPEFLAKDRFSKLVISIFSVDDDAKGIRPRLVAPFTRLIPQRGVAKRFSGFGPLFSGIILLALLQLGLLWRQRFWMFVVLSITASVFAISGTWWARLVPQLWLAVGLLQLGVFHTQPNRWTLHLSRLVAALMVVNSAVILLHMMIGHGQDTLEFHRDVEQVRKDDLRVVVAGDLGCPCDEDLKFYNRIKLTEQFPQGYTEREVCNVIGGNSVFRICEPENAVPDSQSHDP